jgi:Flp pilus assembly protein TadG
VRIRRARNGHERGSALVEFALVCLQLLFVILGTFELGRLVVVYTTVANAARVGVRYAIVHGGTNQGSGLNAPSDPSSYNNVVNVVRSYAGVGLLDLSKLTVLVSYPDGSNAPGSRVKVTTGYAYDPWVILPLNIPLGTATQGVIAF